MTPETPRKNPTGKIVIERLVGGEAHAEDQRVETEKAPGDRVRPLNFSDYHGQDEVKNNLSVFVEAARKRDKQLDHVILHGPPGLGKTTMARIIAHELGADLYETRGPAIDRAGDLAGILTGIKPGSVLFIDEIHRLNVKVEEVLYSAMEDYKLDLIVGQGASARAMPVPVAPFTLIGATTRLSLLSKPLRERFGIQERMQFYKEDALIHILKRSAAIFEIALESGGALEIAKRSRGTPRIANRLLRRVWDFAVSEGHNLITTEMAARVLLRQGVDTGGLDRIDRGILQVVDEQYNGGPVGIEALAATLNEDRATLEEVHEPYLVHQGFLARGPRGRSLTAKGKKHLAESASFF